MPLGLQPLLRAVGVLAVFFATWILSVLSFGNQESPFTFEHGSPLGPVAVLIMGARFLWPFAIGAFVLERFIMKRHAVWTALALGIVPALVVGVTGQSVGEGPMDGFTYLFVGLMYLSPTLWALLGLFLGYVARRTKRA